MTKELRKAIMNGSKLRNNFLKTRNEESRNCFNCQINLCVSLFHETERHFFGKLGHRVVSDNCWASPLGEGFSQRIYYFE